MSFIWLWEEGSAGSRSDLCRGTHRWLQHVRYAYGSLAEQSGGVQRLAKARGSCVKWHGWCCFRTPKK